MGKLVVFVVLTFILVYISRASLRTPRSHGFYRFFAWEFIVALVVLNIDLWFQDPWSWHQLVSWFLLILSIIPLSFGLSRLISRGKSVKLRDSAPELLPLEKTTELVNSGIYHYIRHPLYSSLLLLAWGVFFKSPDFINALLAATATGFLFLTAKADEAECIRFFGSSYQEYMQRTRMFIPFVL